MEPYRRVYTKTHVPCPSAETCTIRLGNHFPDPCSVSPCVTFHADVFSKLGGMTASPHTGGQAQHNRLVELIKMKELKKHAKAEKYNHSKQSWKKACQSYMLPVLLWNTDLRRNSGRHVDTKMFPTVNNSSILEHCR